MTSATHSCPYANGPENGLRPKSASTRGSTRWLAAAARILKERSFCRNALSRSQRATAKGLTSASNGSVIVGAGTSHHSSVRFRIYVSWRTGTLRAFCDNMVIVIFLYVNHLILAMKGEKTRQQFITTAERLFQREGYHGVGLSQLIRESGAPKGSFYFHFPGGKLELAVLTVERSSADVRRLLVEARKASRSAMAYSERIISALKAWLIETDYAGVVLSHR